MGLFKDSILGLAGTAICVASAGCISSSPDQVARNQVYPFYLTSRPTVIRDTCGEGYLCMHELYRDNGLVVGVGIGVGEMPEPDGRQLNTLSLVFRK
jgi:hypothetical protein